MAEKSCCQVSEKNLCDYSYISVFALIGISLHSLYFFALIGLKKVFLLIGLWDLFLVYDLFKKIAKNSKLLEIFFYKNVDKVIQLQ